MLPVIDYKMKVQTENLGPVTLEIASLENLNDTIDQVFAELERSGRPELLEQLCPYFGIVWPSARGLITRLASEPLNHWHGKRVLEIGCGLALPSLVLAKLGAEVTATDYHPEVPRFLARNQELNKTQIRYREVNWETSVASANERLPGQTPLGEVPYDVIVASDVLYEAKHAALVARVIDEHLAPLGTAWLADPARPYLQPFHDALFARGFYLETETVKDVFVLKAMRATLARGTPASRA